jgi:periplasmic protein TonB
MFEQATLSNGSDGKRAWTTFLGLSSQVALVSCAMLAPMVWPQVLPTARFLESLAPPLPPAPPPKPLGELKKEPATVRALKPVPWSLTRYQPNSIPTRVYTIVDEPIGTAVAGVPAGFSGPDVGVVGGILRDLGNAVRVAPPHVPAPVVKPAPELPTVIPRYRVGGDVRLGAVLHRAEPQYPALAKAARVSGDVELECVVGIDGHIHEVKVRSGNPLLVHAAVDAAWQWVYALSKLNGVPIEIVTMLTFSFKLN